MGPYSAIAAIVAGSVAAAPLSGAAAPAAATAEFQATAQESPMTTNLRKLTPLLMELPGVVGVGEGRCDGKPCIKVFVAERTEDLSRRINEIAGDTPVEIVESGRIRAR